MLRSYVISRAFVSLAFTGMLASTGTPLWLSGLSGILVFLLFVWLPRSGRYIVRPELGTTALRRDERTQQIADKAARNAFVVLALALAGATIYMRATRQSVVPVEYLSAFLAAGGLTYFVSDIWLRRG